MNALRHGDGRALTEADVGRGAEAVRAVLLRRLGMDVSIRIYRPWGKR